METVKAQGTEKSLLVVESPAKVRTLKKILGSGFRIQASVGHIKDLPVNRLGVEIEEDFKPQYAVIKGKSKVIKDLKEAAKGIRTILLAPDPDREGEAIAWHIAEELKAPEREIKRVLFHELTEHGVKEALKHPEPLNINRFESQQARRILDRLVGYQISPVLWEKVKRGLSAGRVQSVAVRLVCDREREIQAFVPQEYWSILASLEGGTPPPFEARLIKLREKKIALSSEEEAGQALEAIKSAEGGFRVNKITRKERKKNPLPPFITSTLQQEAFRKLKFTTKQTMALAQGLYEGVDLGDQGIVGLITYMRTDSTRLSQDSLDQARNYILNQFGDPYLPAKSRQYTNKKGSQDAHEAVRPTLLALTPEHLAKVLDKRQLALYTLIWNRFLASQMNPAIYDVTTVDILAGEYLFRAAGSVLTFPGYTLLYEDNGETDEKATLMPPLREKEPLKLLSLTPKQHFTQPPPRYNEGSLVKELEEKGIGRPSTYAAIISTIQDKEYVKKETSYFIPTEMGFLVNDLLVASFPQIMDIQFTAQMEDRLDEIEEGRRTRLEVLKDFYAPFKATLDEALKDMPSIKGKGVPTEIVCEKCGQGMAVKVGKNGPFLACTGFPQCRNTKNFTRDEQGKIQPQEKSQEERTCELCGKPMHLKKGPYGIFWACSGYPECKGKAKVGAEGGPKAPDAAYASTGIPCPMEGCQGTLVKRTARKFKRTFYGCSAYPQCRYALWGKPVAETCPQCGSPFLVEKTTKKGTTWNCPKEGCGYSREPEI
jgi:DNA topoisomerase-1